MKTKTIPSFILLHLGLKLLFAAHGDWKKPAGGNMLKRSLITRGPCDVTWFPVPEARGTGKLPVLTAVLGSMCALYTWSKSPVALV